MQLLKAAKGQRKSSLKICAFFSAERNAYQDIFHPKALREYILISPVPIQKSNRQTDGLREVSFCIAIKKFWQATAKFIKKRTIWDFLSFRWNSFHKMDFL